MRVLVTGANGFVGTALVKRLLAEDGIALRAAVRANRAGVPSGAEMVEVGELGPEADWRKALEAVDVVVHLAARVHVTHERAGDPLAEFRRANVAATRALARQAAEAGVRRFVFLSSLKVNGDLGTHTEAESPAPQDPYAISKSEAEQALADVARDTRMDVVIVRPPLVYGPGVKANFRALMKAVASGAPLPFGSIHNRRSLVALDNLVDFITICLRDPAASNQTFLVSDGEDLSTSDLIRRLARAMRRPARLIPVPASWLLGAASLLGKRDMALRLVGTQCAGIGKARQLLGWAPPVSVDDALRRCVESSHT